MRFLFLASLLPTLRYADADARTSWKSGDRVDLLIVCAVTTLLMVALSEANHPRLPPHTELGRSKMQASKVARKHASKQATRAATTETQYGRKQTKPEDRSLLFLIHIYLSVYIDTDIRSSCTCVHPQARNGWCVRKAIPPLFGIYMAKYHTKYVVFRMHALHPSTSIQISSHIELLQSTTCAA